MQVSEALQGVSQLFLDTAPIVYFVEENPQFLTVVSLIFEQIESGAVIAVVSPVTLAECLVMPCRTGDLATQRRFIELLTLTENIDFSGIDQAVGKKAGELRARYNLRLPDALQIATALQANCEVFLTNDMELKRVRELKVLTVEELAN